MQKQLHKISGQGLIETLIVILFVAISVVALVKFQHYLSYSALTTIQQTDAIALANNKMESLRDFQVLNTTSGYTAYQDIASGTSTATVGNTSYTLTWTVTAYTNPTYKNVSITVSWTDRHNTAQSITLVSNIASQDPSTPTGFMS